MCGFGGSKNVESPRFRRDGSRSARVKRIRIVYLNKIITVDP